MGDAPPRYTEAEINAIADECVPTALPADVADWDADYQQRYGERAARGEYHFGLTRAEAERTAEAETRAAYAREALNAPNDTNTGATAAHGEAAPSHERGTE